MKTLTILRGLPGCGKSTWIKKNVPGAVPTFWASGDYPVIVSADHHFTDRDTDVYTFDPKQLGLAHAKSMSACIYWMSREMSHIIVDNTNSQAWEWSVYKTAAKAFGYEVVVVDLFDGGCTDAELAARNLHGAPIETITAMRERWEKV